MTKRSSSNDPAPSSSPPSQGTINCDDSGNDLWYLEDVFPDVSNLLSSAASVTAAADNTIIVLDTNVLMLPYTVGSAELPIIRDVYYKLIQANRLYVPARAIREFIKNRDSRIAELEKSLNDKASALQNVPSIEIPRVLDDLIEKGEVDKAFEEIKNARANLKKAIEKIAGIIRTWRGNDPVSMIYFELFKDGVVTDHTTSREELAREWSNRQSRKIPPGYKDSSKPDTGVGDFSIWKTILHLGATKKKDLIFITGDEKADWFVRGGNQGIYPRPELISEYRMISEGKHLRLSKLTDILEELEASEDLIEEVRAAEVAAKMASYKKDARSVANFNDLFSKVVNNSRLMKQERMRRPSIKLHTQFVLEHTLVEFAEDDVTATVFIQILSPTMIRITPSEGWLLALTSNPPSQKIELHQLTFTESSEVLMEGDGFVLAHASQKFFSARLMEVTDNSNYGGLNSVEFNVKSFTDPESIESV